MASKAWWIAIVDYAAECAYGVGEANILREETCHEIPLINFTLVAKVVNRRH